MVKISQLPVGTTIAGDEKVAVVQSGVTVQVSASGLAGASNTSVVSPFDYGAIADGSAHALSTAYGSLAAAQVVYPFVTSLTQQIDWAACQQASNVAFGAAGFENASADAHLNKAIDLRSGRYIFGGDTWTIRNLVSGNIYGNGRLATVLTGNDIVLQFDGIWYSELANFSILVQTTGAVTGLDVDGNVPGHPYSTRGVQAVTFRNLLVDGGLSTSAMSLCRQGGAGGQGSECLFLNCHFSQGSFACYQQFGFNALANTFMGGNFQSYPENGIYVTGGTVSVFNTGFQSVSGYTQVVNDGWDINIGSSGAFEGCSIYGCRSESMRFLKNEGGVRCDIRAVVGRNAVAGWAAATTYATDTRIVDGVDRYRVFRATIGGTSHATTEPVWPQDGSTIADNTVTWQEEYIDFIENQLGLVDLNTVAPSCGYIAGTIPKTQNVLTITASTTIYTDNGYDVIIADPTAGNILLTVWLVQVSTTERGKQITVKKSDTGANTVSVFLEGADETAGNPMVIPGGSRGYRTWVYGDGTGGVTRWHLIGSG